MPQPEGPRQGDLPAITQASEESVITPGQVPSVLNGNSEYPDNMLNDDFMQEFDNLINAAPSDHSDYEELDLNINDGDRHYNENYINEFNKFSDDNDRHYVNDNNTYSNDKVDTNDFMDSNNNHNYATNWEDETNDYEDTNDYSYYNNNNQGYEYDNFQHSLSKKQKYENYKNQINQNRFTQHKFSQSENLFHKKPNVPRQSYNYNKIQDRNYSVQHGHNGNFFQNQRYNNNIENNQFFNQRQSFEYNSFNDNPSCAESFSQSKNYNYCQENFNDTNLNESSSQPTMAEILKAITDRNTEIDNLSSRLNEFVSKQPATAPAAPQVVQSFSEKFKNRSRDPEPNLAKLDGVLPCVKTIINVDPAAELKHCIHYDIAEENSWLRLPKPNEYHPTVDNVPETIGTFLPNMDFPGPSKGWWPTSESINDNPREVKTPAQKFIKIPSKASEPQYEAFIQADPLIFVDKQDGQKKKIKLQPEFFGQDQSIYWQGSSTIVSNLETKARSTLKALNQNSQLLKETSARKVSILENLDAHKSIVDGVLTDNPEGPVLRDTLTKDQLLKELEYSVYSDSLLESNNSLAKDICKAQVVECRVDLRHYVLSRTNKDSRNPLFQALKFSTFRSPTLFGQPPRYLAKQAHVNPTCDDFRVKPRKRPLANLAGLYSNSPKRGKGRQGQPFRGQMPRRAHSGKRPNATRGAFSQYSDQGSSSNFSKNEGGSSSRGRAYKAKGKGRGKSKSARAGRK